MKRIILGGLLIMLVGVAAIAVPNSISYQGRLMENGVLVTGAKEFDFAIYDALTGGASLWSVDDVSVECRQGIYSVELGDVGNPVTPGILAGGSAYLQITVGSDVLSPRIKLTSVGFALEAGGITDGAVKDVDVASDAAIAWSKVSKSGATAAEVGAQALDADLTVLAGGAVSVDASAAVGSVFVDSSGQVGIGTLTPEAMLDIVGGLKVSGNIIAATSGNIAIGTSAAPFKEIYVKEVYMGGNTLYMNGIPVLESNDQSMNFSADTNQNLQLQTSGSGVLQFTSGSGGTDFTTGEGGMNFITSLGTGGDISFTSGDQMEFISACDATIRTSGNGKDILLETTGSGSDIVLHAAGNVVMDSVRVGVGTYAPNSLYTVDVSGTINAQAYSGNGSGLTNIPAGSYLAASDNSPAQAVVVDAEGNVNAVGVVTANTVHANNLMMLIQNVEGYSTVGLYKNWGEF
ncbi:MAG: hypothetical protein ABIH39_08770 [Candidatus Margulisiibacteriota bacterium]